MTDEGEGRNKKKKKKKEIPSELNTSDEVSAHTFLRAIKVNVPLSSGILTLTFDGKEK